MDDLPDVFPVRGVGGPAPVFVSEAEFVGGEEVAELAVVGCEIVNGGVGVGGVGGSNLIRYASVIHISRNWYYMLEVYDQRVLTCSISVPTACIMRIQPFALRNASSLPSDPSGQPSKLEKGCSITILRPASWHMVATFWPAEQRVSKSWAETSLLEVLEAKERRSGKPSSMPWNPASAIALSFWSRGVVGVPMDTVA